MLRFIRQLRGDERGVVVIETLLMFVLMLAFISASIRTMKLHANNQQAYMEAHRKALLYVTSPFDVSFLADMIDPFNEAPEIPGWKSEYMPNSADDLKGMLASLSHDGDLGAMVRGKIVSGHELREWSLFNTAVFGMQQNPTGINIQHKVHMIRPPWAFGGFPAVPGQNPSIPGLPNESSAVRTKMGEMIDKELIGFKIFGTPLREYLKMKPIWYTPYLFQDGKAGNY
jgi:hypothetical protein